jgi:hypothetical protein
MVLTLVGPSKLGYSKLSLFNPECDFREYMPLRDTTQWTQFQRFGQPAALCKTARTRVSAGRVVARLLARIGQNI